MALSTCLFAAEIPVRGGTTCGAHSHACTEIVYYLRGCRGVLTQGKQPYPYRPGDVAVYQPSLTHSDECGKSGIQYCIGVTGCGAERLPVGLWRATPGVRRAFAGLAEELGRRDDNHSVALDLLGGRIAVEVRRMLDGLSDADHPQLATDVVTSAKAILETRLGQSLRIQKIASELFVSPDYLRQVFRLRMGESPLHFLLRKRIENACELLQWTDLPIKQIAIRVGIANPYYFSRLFHRWVKQSPSAYRAQRRNVSLVARSARPSRGKR